MIDKYLVKRNDNIYNCLQKINSNKKEFLIIVENLKVIGILTEGDLRRQLLKSKNLDESIHYNENFLYVDTHDSILKIINQFKDDRISFLPILDEEKKIVNVITKKQFHSLLLENISYQYNYDFNSINENEIDHEIYDRPWGFYKSTILTSMAQSKVINVFPKGELSLQEHKKREEHWVIVSGSGKVIIGESILNVYPGKYIYIPKGCKHKITNTDEKKDLIFIEVQLGEYFGEDDIIRYDDIYGRIK